MSGAEYLRPLIRQFIEKPACLEPILSNALAEKKYAELLTASDRQTYTTLSVVSAKPSNSGGKKWLTSEAGLAVYLEHSDQENLRSFYREHGLEPMPPKTLVKEQAASKLRSAFDMLRLVPGCAVSVAALVNCIQVIQSEQPDHDTSYSHPDIPFTIFVSVCESQAMTDNLRVAENILHEAMHLKLTLIEEILPMVRPGSQDTFYSPWREEQRSVRGVLHGIFVFRAILDFYRLAAPLLPAAEDRDFAEWRIETIEAELQQIKDFGASAGLAKEGTILAGGLLSSN